MYITYPKFHFNDGELFPLKFGQLGDYIVSIPNNSEAYLNRGYTDKWKSVIVIDSSDPNIKDINR